MITYTWGAFSPEFTAEPCEVWSDKNLWNYAVIDQKIVMSMSGAQWDVPSYGIADLDRPATIGDARQVLRLLTETGGSA